MGLMVKDREVVVPGEVVAEGMDFLPSYGTYRSDNKIIAQRLGLLQVDGRALKLLPLSGKFPKKRRCDNRPSYRHYDWRLEN